MTESEWPNCSDPASMLEILEVLPISERKQRLYACACCRYIWELLIDERGRKAVETAERFADRLASKAELKRARQAARAARHGLPKTKGKHRAEWEAYWATEVAASENAYPGAAGYVEQVVALAGLELEPTVSGRSFLCDLVLELFANEFRPISIDPSWRTWEDSTVRKLAQAIYDERRFTDLPILADALGDAGCTEAAILAHCREPGEHVRGCWVVDLLLGKE